MSCDDFPAALSRVMASVRPSISDFDKLLMGGLYYGHESKSNAMMRVRFRFIFLIENLRCAFRPILSEASHA